MKMNNKNNNQKIKIINLGKKKSKDVENGKKQTANNNQKKVIESYYIKNNGIQYIKKKLNFENYTTFDKKNNISLFSFLSSYTNHDDKITNNSLKTTKESNYNQINLKYSNVNYKKKNFFYSKNVGSAMNYYHKNNNNKQISHPNFELNKELDNFKNRIDGIMRVIEDFEINYINSSESKRIKDELNNITTNKNYFNKSQDAATSIKDSGGEARTSQKNVKNHQKSIYFRESNKNIFNNEKNSNKTMIIKNHKLNLIDNHQNNKFSSTKNIKNININNTSVISNRNDRNKKKEINKNNIIKNSYNRRINYSSLLEVKTINKEKEKDKDKDKKITKERKKNNDNKNNIFRTKPKTYHYPSKSNDLKNFETIYNYKKTKYKTILNNNIQISTYNKTPKIYKVNKKINKMVKQKSKEYNYTNTNKKIFKKFYK